MDYAPFLFWRTPLTQLDLEDLPDDDDDHVANPSGNDTDDYNYDDNGDDDIISGTKAEESIQECYEDLGIAKLIQRTSHISFHHDYNQLSPLQKQIPPHLNHGDRNHHQLNPWSLGSNGNHAMPESFNDYHFWKAPLALDLELPEVDTEESSSSGSEGSQDYGGGEYEDGDFEDYEDEETEDSALRRMMERTIADVIRGEPASITTTTTTHVSSYSQEQLETIDKNSRRLDIFMIYFRDYDSKFADSLADIKEALQAIGEASHQVLMSEKLPVLFGVVMTLSNKLKEQEGEPASNSRFKIGELEQILSKKSTNGDTSLLHYVAHVLKKNFSGTPSLTEELVAVENAKDVSLKQANQDFVSLKKGFAAIEAELEFQCQTPEDDYDLRIRDMKRFVEESADDLEELEEEADQVAEVFKRTLSFLGEEEATDSSVFFAHLFSLIRSLQRAEEDNLTSRQFGK